MEKGGTSRLCKDCEWTTVLVERNGEQREYIFSHVVSTPLGNYAVFVDPETIDDEDEERPVDVEFFKLVPVTDEDEADMVAHLWAQMGEDEGEE